MSRDTKEIQTNDLLKSYETYKLGVKRAENPENPGNKIDLKSEKNVFSNEERLKEDPDIQIQEIDESCDNFNPFSDSLYSVRTPKSGESINFHNFLCSDLLKRIEEGSPIKTKKSKKNIDKEFSNFSEEDEEAKLKEKESGAHSLFYKNNPQWKISNESLNYIQEKSNLEQNPDNPGQNENFSQNFYVKNSCRDPPHKNGKEIFPERVEYQKDSDELKLDETPFNDTNLENPSTIMNSDYANKDKYLQNYNFNFDHAWDTNPGSPNHFNFPENNFQINSNYYKGNEKSDYTNQEYFHNFHGNNFKTPFNTCESQNLYEPKENPQPNLTFEEFLKLKYQGEVPQRCMDSNSYSQIQQIKNGQKLNCNLLKKDSPFEDYDYCSNSTHSTLTKKMSPFDEVGFYPKNFYPQTPNIKSSGLFRDESARNKIYGIPHQDSHARIFKSDQMADYPHRINSQNNFNKYSQNGICQYPLNTRNFKSFNTLDKFNEKNLFKKKYENNEIGVNIGNKFSNITNRFNGANFNPETNKLNYQKSNTIPKSIYTNPNFNESYQPNKMKCDGDLSKSPLSLNLNINKIKKNANINNFNNLTSNLSKLTTNISNLHNLSTFSNNLPSFENISELNKFIEGNKNMKFDFEQASTSNPSTPQNTPQYKNFQNGKSGWICSSCKNFNYEIRIKCNRCGKPQVKPKLTFIDEKNKNENNDSPKNMSNKDFCNYFLNRNDVCNDVSNDNVYKEPNEKCKNLLINSVNSEISNENSSKSTSPKNNQIEKEADNTKSSADSKKKKKPFVERVGDWVCIKCKNLNFSFRLVCNRCQLSKTESEKLFEQYMKNLMNYVKINELLQNQIMTNQNLMSGSNSAKPRIKSKNKPQHLTQEESANSSSVLFNGEDYFPDEPYKEAQGKNNPM